MAKTTETVAAGRLGHTIKRAEQALIGRKTDVLREFGLTVPQYSVLLLLSVSDGMSAAQLARECMVTPQTMATVLTNLEKAGMVFREPSELHQKVVVNRATRAGRAVAKQADKAALRVEGTLGAEFTPEERARFEEYLERAISVLDSIK
ncbi:DNA-binding MarR family transcriptional regulator [Streptomyces ambofaciens]|jgi:DNA-binding MarR family transcriptional regulator|uniref:MarR family winged helix-turn-helix transcriptional regulator n=1 Tax=unclassified Streptomyces TaxID=2593676 RepID=UPI00075018C7|nr:MULTISPECIES: MarR family transcriptional regulator [unclassified Streptomyces]MBQ0890573.1 MarR family transcriptional regulator [Streptomyces sp. RM72]OMI88732.1 MarR family transcriptional regulator [Streptomyces sp. M1013]